MSEKLNSRITKLENEIIRLNAKIIDLSKNTENRRQKPETRISQLSELHKWGRPLPSSGTGLGKIFGRQSNIIFNNADASNPGFGNQPAEPTKGYNKHGHSRYAGGALDINTLELVEYVNTNSVILDQYGNPVNKHCQSYWKNQPGIIKDDNNIEKISNLSKNIVWDKEEKCWRFYAVYSD